MIFNGLMAVIEDLKAQLAAGVRMFRVLPYR